MAESTTTQLSPPSPAEVDVHYDPQQHTQEDYDSRYVLGSSADDLLPVHYEDYDSYYSNNNDYLDMPATYSSEREEAEAKLHNLMQVVHNSLVPCLVATPLVYLGDSKWKLQSHSAFRTKKRERLESMIDIVKTKRDVDYEKLMEEFEGIIIEMFKVRLPAMIDVYMNDSSYQRVPVQKISVELCAKVLAARPLELKERASAHAATLIQWYTYPKRYCPVGRPRVYLSDDHWSLVSESELRKYYRQQIASQLFTIF